MKTKQLNKKPSGSLDNLEDAPLEDSTAYSPQRNGYSFPTTRLRRNRQSSWSREMVSENALNIRDLIWPGFVIEGRGEEEAIPSMPGVKRYSIDKMVEQAKFARDLSIPAIALFPVVPPELKSVSGNEALNPKNLICRCVREVKDAVPEIGIISDIALDPYTSHGHDGIVQDGEILNDETVELLAQQALIQAETGVDILAPSDMMDGRIGRIRAALDQNGFQNKQILSYAAKYASAFYGPFRDAVQSKGCLKGDKASYQMDPANSREALREVELDIQEGADMVMIKPGLPYLDIIRDVKQTFNIPTLAYNVSGEYTMLKMACENGALDAEKTMLEMLICFKRAGADGILTYFAIDAAKALNK